MSNKISRRSFLKCAGVSAAAVSTAGLLGGCRSSSNSVEVKVGDQISNWNNLTVRLNTVYKYPTTPSQEGYEYVIVLVMARNLTANTDFAIGAQNVLDIDAAYPVPPTTNVDAYFDLLAQSTEDFAVSCDGASAKSGAYVYLYDEDNDSFSDSPSLPAKRAGYICLMSLVPTGWSELEINYTPTFVANKTMTFVIKSTELSDVNG